MEHWERFYKVLLFAQMELSSGTLIFVAATQKTPLDHLAYAHNPTGLYIFTYFESCCLRVWLPISLNLINSLLRH